jgi:hypothetical protein
MQQWRRTLASAAGACLQIMRFDLRGSFRIPTIARHCAYFVLLLSASVDRWRPASVLTLHIGAGVVTNEVEEVFLHDRENERGNQLSDPHTSDLCLYCESTNHFLI